MIGSGTNRLFSGMGDGTVAIIDVSNGRPLFGVAALCFAQGFACYILW